MWIMTQLCLQVPVEIGEFMGAVIVLNTQNTCVYITYSLTKCLTK